MAGSRGLIVANNLDDSDDGALVLLPRIPFGVAQLLARIANAIRGTCCGYASKAGSRRETNEEIAAEKVQVRTLRCRIQQ